MRDARIGFIVFSVTSEIDEENRETHVFSVFFFRARQSVLQVPSRGCTCEEFVCR